MNRERRSLGLGVTAGLIAAVLLLVIVPTLKGPPRLEASASEVETGNLPGSGNQPGNPYVNFTLKLESPETLSASQFVIEVKSPNETILLWNGTRVPYVQLLFESGTNPPWAAQLSGNERWSGYSAVVTNPDRSSIGVVPSPAGVVVSPDGSAAIRSGATITLIFPVGTATMGYSVRFTALGLSGSAESAVR